MCYQKRGSRKALTPFARIAGSVKHAVNSHFAFRMLVKDRIRKAADEPAAIAFVYNGMHLRGPANRLKASLNAAQEVLSQANPPTFVPGITLCNVLLGFRR
jgi:hypothetical protein